MSGDDRLLAAVETNDKEKLTSMLRKRQPHQAEVREALEHAVTQATPELARLLATHKSVYRSGDVLAGLLQLGIKHGSRWSRRQEAVVEVLKILIETGADLEYCDGHGRTSLHIAAQHAFPHAVDLLVKHGANPDARDCKQQTPLMVAVQSQGRVPAFVACDERETDRFNRLSTVVLLQPVSAVDGRDRSGKTAEEMANENGFREAAHILKKDVSAGDSKNHREVLETTITLLKKKLKGKEKTIGGLQERIVWLERSLAVVEQDTDERLFTKMRRAMSESGTAMMGRLRRCKEVLQKRPISNPKQTSTEEAADQEKGEFVVVDETIEPGIIMETRSKDIDVFHIIARDIPLHSLRFVGRRLGIADTELDNIEYRYRSYGLPEVCYNVLLAWKNKAVWHKRPIDDLLLALAQEGLSDLAEKVASMSLKDQKNFC